MISKTNGLVDYMNKQHKGYSMMEKTFDQWFTKWDFNFLFPFRTLAMQPVLAYFVLKSTKYFRDNYICAPNWNPLLNFPVISKHAQILTSAISCPYRNALLRHYRPVKRCMSRSGGRRRWGAHASTTRHRHIEVLI